MIMIELMPHSKARSERDASFESEVRQALLERHADAGTVPDVAAGSRDCSDSRAELGFRHGRVRRVPGMIAFDDPSDRWQIAVDDGAEPFGEKRRDVAFLA